MRVFISDDTAARSVGADAVAHAFADIADVEVIRTGSRGLLWLEPLVEVETPEGRIAYGPVRVADVEDLLRAGALHGGAHALRIGDIAAHPWFAAQDRLTFARVGIIDPRSLDDFLAHGGFAGLRRALTLAPSAIVEEVVASGLRGRGGAGFPAGIKWRTVAATEAERRYVVCNADEGDSGTFADRMLIEGDPFTLIEGMAIAGLAVNAEQGIVYLRSEYPAAIERLEAAIATAHLNGWLGDDIAGSGRSFDLEVRTGAGSYVCGEETAMLESIEGRRGMVRAKPPIPAVHGLYGFPTVVNNVLTLASVPAILRDGGAAYAARGIERSRGTQVFQLGGNIARGGVLELPFGVTVRELVEGFGGGTRSGRPIGAVQVGGPLGSYLGPDELDVATDYETLLAAGGMLGHGGIVVFDDTIDLMAQARFAMEFCAIESCGKCTPCRIGSTRGVETIDRIIAGERADANRALLDDLLVTMTDGSLCALGGLTPLPVRSALRLAETGR